jgi:predicted peptidase
MMRTPLQNSMRQRLFVWLGLLLAGLGGQIRTFPAAPDEFAARVFTNAARQTMPYRILLPNDVSSQKAFPLVLFFHGAGERGADNQKQLVHGVSLFLRLENRDRYPCFVLAPQCPEGQQWVDMPWGADFGERPAAPSAAMRLALDILDSVIREIRVDTNRIYVTGLSMGGFAAWDCITRFPDRFAAAAAVCGGGDEHTVTRQVARVPVWAFHSRDDSVVKFKRTENMVQALRDAGGHPKFSEYSELGHDSWDKAYSEPELLPWMFAQRLGKLDTYSLKTNPAAGSEKAQTN